MSVGNWKKQVTYLNIELHLSDEENIILGLMYQITNPGKFQQHQLLYFLF